MATPPPQEQSNKTTNSKKATIAVVIQGIMIVIIILSVGLFLWGFISAASKASEQEHNNYELFCANNHGLYTQQFVHGLLECRDATDHHIFLIDMNTSARYESTTIREYSSNVQR